MKLPPVCLTLLVALAVTTSARAETPLNETRSVLEKWIETRQLISRTRSDWQSDKEMIEQTSRLFERELKAVEDKSATIGTNSVQVEKEKIQAEARLKSSNESIEKAKQFAAGFETRLQKLVPQLPAPLQETLKPLLSRMPADSANSTMATTERIQAIVGVLSELDKFNNAVSVYSEKRKNGKGEEVAVETMYIGLGAAYFVNDAGHFSGMGMPGPQGWEWDLKPEIAASVREAVRIYRNERPARFVQLPAVIR